MKKLIFASCALVMIAAATSVQASIPVYVYSFAPSTGDGYPLTSWGGELFLDAPMSSGGSLGDIESGSFLKTPYGTFNLDGSTDESIATVATVPVPFTWTSAAITSMDITGLGPLNVGGSLDEWEITQISIEISQPDPTSIGQWLAGVPGTPGVPDSASTVGLIGLAVIGLGGFSYFTRDRKSAIAPK